MENSSIGKLAKEISEELNPDDLKDLENPVIYWEHYLVEEVIVNFQTLLEGLYLK